MLDLKFKCLSRTRGVFSVKLLYNDAVVPNFHTANDKTNEH